MTAQYKSKPDGARTHRGRTSYHAGVSAEIRVAEDYKRRGYRLVAERWRGTAGELDLVFSAPDGVVIVEVKQAKSLETAATRISPRQVERIFSAAMEYVSTLPKGLLTDMRFDAALVDQQGVVRIIENAMRES